jgi:hypothetical protein
MTRPRLIDEEEEDMVEDRIAKELDSTNYSSGRNN